jgi:hypothetical protein
MFQPGRSGGTCQNQEPLIKSERLESVENMSLIYNSSVISV